MKSTQQTYLFANSVFKHYLKFVRAHQRFKREISFIINEVNAGGVEAYRMMAEEYSHPGSGPNATFNADFTAAYARALKFYKAEAIPCQEAPNLAPKDAVSFKGPAGYALNDPDPIKKALAHAAYETDQAKMLMAAMSTLFANFHSPEVDVQGDSVLDGLRSAVNEARVRQLELLLLSGSPVELDMLRGEIRANSEENGENYSWPDIDLDTKLGLRLAIRRCKPGASPTAKAT